ncbi:hypothetical protein L0222_06555 [bacterium]|nr:hypothetical protein [bacterium]MCI0603936.1 hypothetical protein [bacterium]
MKKVISVILPLILAAQLPFGTMKYLTSEWMNSIEYGLKWTELMVSGYPGASETQESEEIIPHGEVTMTVTLASAIPEIEELPMIEIEKEICQVHMQQELQKKHIKILRRNLDLKNHRLIRVGTVNLVQL